MISSWRRCPRASSNSKANRARGNRARGNKGKINNRVKVRTKARGNKDSRARVKVRTKINGRVKVRTKARVNKDSSQDRGSQDKVSKGSSQDKGSQDKVSKGRARDKVNRVKAKDRAKDKVNRVKAKDRARDRVELGALEQDRCRIWTGRAAVVLVLDVPCLSSSPVMAHRARELIVG